MSRRTPLLVFAAISATALVLLLGPAALAVVRGGLNLGILFITSHIFFVDSADFIMRLYHRHLHVSPEPGESAAALSVPLRSGDLTERQKRIHVRPYALLASVANLGPDVESFVRAMEPHKDRLWVIDDASTDDTRLMLRKAGIRCIAGFPNRKKPGALRELVRQLPPEIVTVLVLDPDSRILDSSGGSLVDLESSLFDFQRSGMAGVCPRLTLQGEGWLAKLQKLEYCFTFSLVRKSLADLAVTSGIAVYRRDALEAVLERHSLSVYAEDLRNALLLLARGERIYYDGRLVVETEPKRTWREWFSQRVGWFYGLLKVYLEQVRDVGHIIRQGSLPFYQYAIYLGVFTILLHPVKVVSLLLLVLSLANGADYLLGLGIVPNSRWSEPSYFLLIWLMYTSLTVVMFYLCVDRRERAELAPVVPVYVFYALAQIVPATFGYLNWFTVRITGRRIYRDHFEGDDRPGRNLTSGPGRVPA